MLKKNDSKKLILLSMKYASCPFAAGFIYIIATTNVFAINALETQQLEQLDTQTRLEQRCDIEAMERLHKDTKWSPDKVLAYAYSDPKTGHHSIKAEGAAFRAKGKWYHLSYNCIAEDNHITIKSFDYKIGKLIPRKNWEKHYLVP